MIPDAEDGVGRGSTRRFVLRWLPLFLASGCGFRPIYGDSGGPSPPARQELAAISVAIIPERSGQLLRQALQERFQRFGADAPRRYDLRATFSVTGDPVAIEADSTVTRVRVVGYAEYAVVGLGPDRGTVTSGSARALDGYDEINQQFFAGDLDSEAVTRRVAAAVADQIALQLGVFFAHRPGPGVQS